jgi:hypothetical protein
MTALKLWAAAEALDGDAEWSEVLVLVSIGQCTGSESVLALRWAQECTVPHSPLEK